MGGSVRERRRADSDLKDLWADAIKSLHTHEKELKTHKQIVLLNEVVNVLSLKGGANLRGFI